MSSLYIVDISSLMFRAYYGIKQELTTTDGTPIKAVYGVIKMLTKIVKQYSPTELVIVYDSQKKLKRAEYYKEYKANRSAAPDDLKVQFPILKEFVQVGKFESFEIDGYEADDIIATLTEKYREQFDEVVIVSGDKDLMQLVDEKVVVYDGMKNKTYDTDGVFDKFKVYPDQIVDYLSLIGDSSDNVPGVKKIGPKTASSLLSQFKTLDNIYKNISLIKGKKREHLINGEKDGYLSKKLISLNKDLPISINKFMDGGIDLYTNELLNFYHKYQLSSIIGNRQFNINSSKKDETVQEIENLLVDKIENYDSFIENIKDKESYSIYIETTSTDPKEGELIGISFVTDDNKIYSYYAVSEEETKKFFTKITPYLSNDEQYKIAHDVKYLIHFFDRYGIEFKGYFDTMLASYVIDATAHNHSLDNAVFHYLDQKVTSFSEAVSDIDGKDLKDVKEDKTIKYLAERGYFVFKLYKKFNSLLKEMDLQKVYYDIDLPLVAILADMERSGIYLNINCLTDLKKEFNKVRKELERKIWEEAGEEFNVNSPKQLSHILFEKLNLPVIKRIKTGYSTDEQVLLKLSDYTKIAPLMLEYRELTKLVTTYLEGLTNLANSGVVHTSFNQTITATGRLSSSNPNLQNIPIRTEMGRKIRSAFQAREGKKFVILDYSQVELRILAHLSKDPTFLEAFKNGEDIHKRTASEVFDIPLDKVTKKERSASKAINFGLIYGMGGFKLSKELNIKVRDANSYIDKYFKRYKTIKNFKDETLETVKKEKKVLTYFGRVRYFPDIDSRNMNIRNHVERMAFNTLIQGTAADLIKIVMVKVNKFLQKLNYDAKMLLQVHDELIFEVDDKYSKQFLKDMVEVMENSVKLDIPLKVDGVISDSWEK